MSMSEPVEFLSIGELARNTASTPRLIRYFEGQGVISSVPHDDSNVYPRSEERRLKIALVLRELGFSARQMRSIFMTYALDQLNDLSWTPGFAAILTKHLEQLEEQQQRLEQQIARTKAILHRAQSVVVLFVTCAWLT
jgi:DNA-binding transcriptional MerR regulator